MTSDDVLRGALAQVQFGWTCPAHDDMGSGASAFQADGTPTWWGDPLAVRMCVGSAMLRAARAPACHGPSLPPGVPEPYEEWPHMLAYADAVERVERFTGGMSYGMFNDCSSRGDVIGVLEAALRD